MRVKRLEIQGFKSFKDKTVIHFDHGITGIVGPNGCGKSNIVDAFFWVMGEQSYKHMRGSSSEDLIFNGSSKYSPMGIAEATLVMETDVPADAENGQAVAGPDAPSGAVGKMKAKEVSVTRKLYRSGEGEYFINGTLARLKDIQELFMDTGVGAKGYSVIEQGQIGKIVNSKPEERRLLIEEAAGIAKYKARKKESLRKLEAAEANLGRLRDVIAEIERSLNSLDRQAQKARQYKKFKEELLDKEMTWGRRKTQVLRQKLTELQKDKTALEQELVGLKAELHTAETSIESDRLAQVVDNQSAEELQTKISKISDELATERSALELSRRRQGDLAEQLESLETEKVQVQETLEEETRKLEERRIEALEAEEEHRASAAKAQSMDEAVRKFRQETEAARRVLDQSKRELMRGITEASDLASKSASLESRAQTLESQLERLKSQAQAVEAKLEAAKGESARLQVSSEELQAKLSEALALRQEAQTQLGSFQSELRIAEQTRDQSTKALTQVRSKLESLEELASTYEGFGEAPKAALDWAKTQGLGEKLVALADAYQVGSDYEAAFAGFLDSRVESLIAQDTEVALGALREILVGKQGRLEIQLGLADSKAEPAAKATDALQSAGLEVVGLLSDLITVDSRLAERARQIAHRLISQVAVVRSLDPVKSVASSLQGWTLVTLDGSVYDSATQTLRGGAANTDQSAALLRRKRMISELQDQVTQAQTAADQAIQAFSAKKSQLEQAQARASALQSEIQDLQVEKAALDRDLHQSARAVEDTQAQIELNSEEIAEIESTLESGRAEREEIESKMSAILSARAELEGKISQDDNHLAAQDAEVRSQETELQALRVSEASLKERSSSLKRELETSRLLIQDREKRIADIARTLEKAAQERSQYNGGESQLEKNIQELTLTLTTARQELSTVKDRLEQSSATLNGALEKIKALHKQGDQKTADTNQLALEVEKVSSDLSHLIQNLEEKYGPGCLELPVTSPIQEEMTEPVVTAEMTAEEEHLLGEEVERLRERIRRLGEVNVGAIEEYEETKKRFDHLSGEKLDLEASIQNLKDAIEHINKTSEERFRKAFEAIADRFERLFPIIFGGGQANLSLVYPEGSKDILDAGVDILAQPPGKKVVNIGLLSGGEKALTAVSLIFAIFMVKPSPFCVLDEVDAPLDDANIGKFNALLREMSAKSQFILITHNKKTMELNDTLYGVTMEEPGVSKMVSIEMH